MSGRETESRAESSFEHDEVKKRSAIPVAAISSLISFVRVNSWCFDFMYFVISFNPSMSNLLDTEANRVNDSIFLPKENIIEQALHRSQPLFHYTQQKLPSVGEVLAAQITAPDILNLTSKSELVLSPVVGGSESWQELYSGLLNRANSLMITKYVNCIPDDVDASRGWSAGFISEDDSDRLKLQAPHFVKVATYLSAQLSRIINGELPLDFKSGEATILTEQTKISDGMSTPRLVPANAVGFWNNRLSVVHIGAHGKGSLGIR